MFNFNHHSSYTPDTISRNIKRVKNGVIEVCRYSDAKFKQFVWLWIIAIIGVMTFQPEYRNSIYSDIEWAISPDIRLIPQYNELHERRIRIENVYPIYERFPTYE